MKFTFDRDALLKEVIIAQEIISIKNALSILSNILFIAENNSLTIKATDIKVNFETKIPVEIEEPGTTTVFCDKFMSILNSLPSGDIEFAQKDIKITIKPVSKKASFQLKSMASDKFPEFSSQNDNSYFEVPAAEFKDMISQTIFAVSNDETRHFMNGILFEKKEENLTLVATDGRRLGIISKPLCQGIDDFPRAIVPPKILSILLKRLPSEGNLSIAIINKQIFFKFANYEFASVLIEGQFPDYNQAIPKKQDKSFEIQKSDMVEALKRVSLLVEQKSRRIYFELFPGKLIIRSQESEIGTAKEEIPCQYDGDEIIIALNYLYVEEPLKVIDTERIVFEFTEQMRAVTLRPEPASDFFHIIMPMQME